MMVLLGYFLVAGIAVISSAAPAYSQVRSKTRSKDCGREKRYDKRCGFLKNRTDRHDKFLEFAANFYIEQIKWSLISPEKHGGWPVRSFIVEEPDWIADIYRNLKKKAEETDDSLVDYALICPRLVYS